MSRPVVFKIFVQKNEVGMDVLGYIDKNIDAIVDLGAKIQIERIRDEELDNDLLEAFRKRKIGRFPAMVAHNIKDPLIGLKRIVEYFEDNIKKARNNERTAPVSVSEYGSNPALSEYYMREMFAGKDQRGALVPRTDDEDDMEEKPDFQRRMAEYERKVPKQRRQDAGPRNAAPQQRRTRTELPVDEPEQNIVDDDDYEEPRPRNQERRHEQFRNAPSDDPMGDDMDQRMLAAWMSNTEQ